ncbi:DUF6461 domain-containing protein [Streptomyces sp. NPDC057798]|uniref:DUF6461 domain-containing protein n=1 Tax=Streptomyces sp. NPDC057798 TaxID=3346252 RepID=UPI00367C9568
MSMEIFPNTLLYEFGYCAIFAKGIAPADLLARATDGDTQPVTLSRVEADVIVARGEDADEEDLPDQDLDALYAAGLFDDGPLLRAGSHGGWSFVIEAEGPYLADDEVLKAVSEGTVALAVRESESGSTWICYAENGDLLSSFDPLFPDQDYGTQPQVLEELTGHVEAIRAGQRPDAFTNAVGKIRQALHCTVPPEADAGPLLAVRIAGGYD